MKAAAFIQLLRADVAAQTPERRHLVYSKLKQRRAVSSASAIRPHVEVFDDAFVDGHNSCGDVVSEKKERFSLCDFLTKPSGLPFGGMQRDEFFGTDLSV